MQKQSPKKGIPMTKTFEVCTNRDLRYEIFAFLLILQHSQNLFTEGVNQCQKSSSTISETWLHTS